MAAIEGGPTERCYIYTKNKTTSKANGRLIQVHLPCFSCKCKSKHSATCGYLIRDYIHKFHLYTNGGSVSHKRNLSGVSCGLQPG